MLSAVCAIVKNEESSIAEWIAYQRLIGFDTVVIYDNGSSDRTADIVKRISHHDASVSYVSWPDVAGQAPQKTAYQHAIAMVPAEWIALFDVDEFLVLQSCHSMAEFLAGAPRDAGAIVVNWHVFGSSGRIAPGRGLVIERFLRCARRRHPKNRFCKTIVRRDSISETGVHLSKLSHGHYVDARMRRVVDFENNAKMPYVCSGGAQLNHYLLKSWDEFCRKRERGNAARVPEAVDKFSHRGNITSPPKWNAARNTENEYWITHDLNLSTDRRASERATSVRSILREWGLAAPDGVNLLMSERRRMWSNILGSLTRIR